MKKDFEYERAKIEVLKFDNTDIITTSGGENNVPLGKGDDWNGGTDGFGWT